MIIIPINIMQSAQVVTISLDGREFRVHATWNAEMESWYIDIDDVSGNRLLTGQRMSINYPVNLHVWSSGLPDSLIIPLNINGSDDDPTRTSPGTETKLVYAGVA